MKFTFATVESIDHTKCPSITTVAILCSTLSECLKILLLRCSAAEYTKLWLGSINKISCPLMSQWLIRVAGLLVMYKINTIFTLMPITIPSSKPRNKQVNSVTTNGTISIPIQIKNVSFNIRCRAKEKLTFHSPGFCSCSKLYHEYHSSNDYS